jgi:hypothetical protein
MQEYRAYVIGPDGHIQRRFDLLCADDEAAKERAQLLVNGRDLELWQFDRMVAKFTYKSHTDQVREVVQEYATTGARSSRSYARCSNGKAGGLFHSEPAGKLILAPFKTNVAFSQHPALFRLLELRFDLQPVRRKTVKTRVGRVLSTINFEPGGSLDISHRPFLIRNRGAPS